MYKWPHNWANIDGTETDTQLAQKALEGVTFDANSKFIQLNLVGLGLEGDVTGVDFGGCSDLTNVDLSHNKLRGSMPIFNLNTALQSLNIANNEINQLVKFKMSQLLHLDISNNVLAGNVPVGFFNGAVNILSVQLQNNTLSGKMPFFNECEKLQTVDISHNGFEGDLHYALTNNGDLLSADFSHNSLSGDIDSQFSCSFRIQKVKLWGNDKLECGECCTSPNDDDDDVAADLATECAKGFLASTKYICQVRNERQCHPTIDAAAASSYKCISANKDCCLKANTVFTEPRSDSANTCKCMTAKTDDTNDTEIIIIVVAVIFALCVCCCCFMGFSTDASFMASCPCCASWAKPKPAADKQPDQGLQMPVPALPGNDNTNTDYGYGPPAPAGGYGAPAAPAPAGDYGAPAPAGGYGPPGPTAPYTPQQAPVAYGNMDPTLDNSGYVPGNGNAN
jgi:hypothetical protein